MRIVVKFGGTSLADGDRIRNAARKVLALAGPEDRVAVVVSAQGHTTDHLTEAAAALAPKASQRELDALLAAGEQMSAALMAMALEDLGRPAVSLTGWQAGIVTDEAHGNARILGLEGWRIRREWDQGRIVVVAGFQGLSPLGDITTLGRGGSDTTAVALAAFLEAQVCKIYTDVDGVYDRDPRQYPQAVRFDRIGYEQMLALAEQGAQVLHDRSVILARDHGVRLEVLSAFRPGPGTMVGPWPPHL